MKRRNVLSALAAAKDLPQLSLVDSLERTVLVARKDPRRHPRVAARWLLRLLEEHSEPTIEEAALAAASLVALTGGSYRRRRRLCRAMAETATSDRVAPSVRSVWLLNFLVTGIGSPVAPIDTDNKGCHT